jgi:hypothetical protein
MDTVTIVESTTVMTKQQTNKQTKQTHGLNTLANYIEPFVDEVSANLSGQRGICRQKL